MSPAAQIRRRSMGRGPIGWPVLRQDTNTGGLTQTISWKVAEAGDVGGAVTVTLPYNGRQVATFSAWSGVDTVSPFDVHGATTSTSDATSFNAPSVTTTGANRETVQFFSAMYTGGITVPALTVPAVIRVAPTTPSADFQPNSKQSSQAQAVAGASGTQGASVSPSSNWIAANVALKGTLPVFRTSTFREPVYAFNPTLTIPGGVQVGDIMLICHATRSGLPSALITSP